MTSKVTKHGETKIDKNIFRASKNDASLINYIGSKLLMNDQNSLQKKKVFY